jgi:methyltransferase (TIGR00027 family)
LTALAVAAARAVGGVDPMAAELLPRPIGAAMNVLGDVSKRSPFLGAAINAASFGVVDHLELRTAAIDEAVTDGVRAGAEQLVVLGAGLDARAWRMPQLSSAVVYEIDHPATQAYKRARFETRASLAMDVRFVEVDFARDSLADALAYAGHRTNRRTFWIWEGVTMYIPHEAMRSTLSVIGARSARGSRAAITYATSDASPFASGLTRAGRAVLRGMGEPILGTWTEETIADALAREAFDVLEDTQPREWPRAEERRRLLFVPERLVVAEKA